jgi:hypothetical protein
MPGITGIVGADSGPIAVIRKRPRALRPSAVAISHWFAASSYAAEAIFAWSVISRRRSSLSATKLQ